MAEDVAVSDFDGLYEKFTAAFEGEDYDALRAMCASKAVMVNLAGVVLSGRDSFVGFLQRAQRVQNLRFAVSDTSVLSDAAVRQVGSLTLTVRGEGREMREVPATFLMLWVKADGQWQIDSCVWTRLRTDGGGRAGGRGGRGGMGAGGRGMPGGGGRTPIRRPGPDEGGAFNPRNMGLRPDQVPLISRID